VVSITAAQHQDLAVSLCLTPRIEAIAQEVTGRPVSLFAPDVQAQQGVLAAAVAGRRILVAGGAGSIGSATIMELLRLEPAALAVLDPSENNLVELMRSIRSQDHQPATDVQIEPLDYGSALAAGWLGAQRPFDVVLSFAALKHVRSERDTFSLLRLLEVNLLQADRFLATLRRQGHGARGVFFVSTDKAANPVSLMGASKRVMELLLWAHAQAGAPASLLAGGSAPPLPQVTAARFANVAFSDGSLPWGFLQRLEKRQPLAAPGDVRRYLLSPREAGQLCLLAALCCPHRHVLVPLLDPVDDLVSFTDIAVSTLRAFDLEPAWFEDAARARAGVTTEQARGRYPILVTTSDTSGEKDIEEFVARGEQAREAGLAAARVVAGPVADIPALATVLQGIALAVDGTLPVAKRDLVDLLTRVVPELAHRETGTSLDGKM
jgi:FlaA1/EpsC-like NDP-sugar epimerase